MKPAESDPAMPGEDGHAGWGAAGLGSLGLGTELRSERILLGRTLDDVSAHLRIRKDQLEAIEEGNFKRLPGTPYAIGFVRSYAEYLGFDGPSAVARFKAEAELPDPARLNFPEPVPEAKAPTAKLLAGSVALLVGIYLGFSYIDRNDVAIVERIPPLPADLLTPPPPPPAAVATAPAPQAAPTAPAVANAELPQTSWRDAAAATTESEAGAALPPAAPSPSPAASAEPGAAPATAAATDQVASVEPAQGAAYAPMAFGSANGDSRIVLHAERDSWIQIQGRNNEVLATKVLRAGDSMVVPNRPGARLTTGNAGGLEILVDGRPVQRLGAEGAVVRNISLDPQHLTNRSGN